MQITERSHLLFGIKCFSYSSSFGFASLNSDINVAVKCNKHFKIYERL